MWCDLLSSFGLRIGAAKSRLMHLILHLQALTPTERDWVDAYHAEVWDKVSPRVSGPALEWLRANTAPLEVVQAAPALVAA